MLTTIQELEKEIDQFHKNIKDSNELMRILMSVASLTKTQTGSFEARTKALHEELSKLPPELSNLFQKKIESFIQEIHGEHQSYQSAVTNLMDRYSEKIATAESAIAKVPGILDAQNEAAHKKYLEDLGAVEAGHVQKINTIIEQHSVKLSSATGALEKFPTELEEQLQKDRSENVAGLKQIQEQYAADLAKANEAFAKQLQAVVDAIQAVPGQINDNSAQQYNAFLKELEKMMDTRLAQLSATEKRVEELSQQLEAKYNAFVGKLESTNMDQLYKYCQDMNKSINTKLGIALGGIAVAVIASIISLFI